MAYLRGHYELEDEVNEVRMKHKTRNYKIINNQLYKQGVNHFSNAYQQKTEKNYCQKYMRRLVAHIQGQEPWQGKHSDKDFIGIQHKVTAKK